MTRELQQHRYIAAVCGPQTVNSSPTGPSMAVYGANPTAAALAALSLAQWDEPGYIEVIVYRAPKVTEPKTDLDGLRYRLRIWLEPDR